MRATGSVLLNSGGYLALRGAKINADKDVTLLAAHNADLNYRELDGRFNAVFPVSRTPELGSRVHAGGNLLINSARDIGTQGGALSANGNITLLAGQNLWLSNLAYSAIDAANDNNKDDRHVVTALSAGKNLTASANNQLLTYGARLTSGANMTLTSGGDMRFEAVQNHTYREGGNEFTETRTQQGTELNAGGLMTVISGGSILFQATKLVVKGLGANWKPSVAVTDWGSRIAAAEQAVRNAEQNVNQKQNVLNNVRNTPEGLLLDNPAQHPISYKHSSSVMIPGTGTYHLDMGNIEIKTRSDLDRLLNEGGKAFDPFPYGVDPAETSGDGYEIALAIRKKTIDEYENLRQRIIKKRMRYTPPNKR